MTELVNVPHEPSWEVLSTGQQDHFWEWEEGQLGISTETLIVGDNGLSRFPVMFWVGEEWSGLIEEYHLGSMALCRNGWAPAAECSLLRTMDYLISVAFQSTCYQVWCNLGFGAW